MIVASRTQFHVERPWGQRLFSIVSYNSVLNVKAVVGAFNQEKALVEACSVIVKTGCGTDESICGTNHNQPPTRFKSFWDDNLVLFETEFDYLVYLRTSLQLLTPSCRCGLGTEFCQDLDNKQQLTFTQWVHTLTPNTILCTDKHLIYNLQADTILTCTCKDIKR